MSRKLMAMFAPKLEAAKATYEAFVATMETGTPLTPEQEAEFATAKKDFFELADRMVEWKAEVERIDGLNSKLAGIESAIGNDDKVEHADPNAPEPRFRTADRPKTTLGEAYVASDNWKHYLGTARGHSGADVDFSGEKLEKLALISSKDVGGKPIAGFWKAADAAMPNRTTPLMDACGSEQVGSGEFWWIEWPVNAPTASKVAEGAPAPESSYPPEVRNGTLAKLVAQLPVTQEALDDNVRMRSIIDGALADGVRQAGEAETGTVLVAADLPVAPGEGTLLEQIRRGVGKVSNAGFDPATVVLNPMDYAEIDIDLLTKTLNGARANSPLWALNVVPAGAVAPGTAYVGDFLAGVRIFWRAGVSISMTDSHEAEFIAGILRIKATQRIDPKVVRPEALAKCVGPVEIP